MPRQLAGCKPVVSLNCLGGVLLGWEQADFELRVGSMVVYSMQDRGESARGHITQTAYGVCVKAKPEPMFVWINYDGEGLSMSEYDSLRVSQKRVSRRGSMKPAADGKYTPRRVRQSSARVKALSTNWNEVSVADLIQAALGDCSEDGARPDTYQS